MHYFLQYFSDIKTQKKHTKKIGMVRTFATKLN